jgi:hypothetical protein
MSGKRFVHVVLTRFSVKIAGGRFKDRAWLAHRFELFDRFCFPSVRAQSCQNFHWLLFLDSSLPPDFRSRISEYTRQFPRLIPIYISQFFTQAVARRAVAPFLSGMGHLITTRLDNDDAIATRFVESVQSRFETQDFGFVNLPHGFVYCDRMTYAWSHPCNPFISLIERVESFQTVLCGCHADLWRLGPVNQVEDIPGWLQIVHGNNLANSVKGIPVKATEWAPYFSIYPSCLEERSNAYHAALQPQDVPYQA